MTHACCPDCRLRVITASPAGDPPCPACGQPMVRTAAAESLGYRLVNVQQQAAAAAVAVASALDLPRTPRS